jgi:hypothetical protein
MQYLTDIVNEKEQEMYRMKRVMNSWDIYNGSVKLIAKFPIKKREREREKM